ncbi:hypothetical protein EV122DRAFT_283240 [Schizophyllum commune]
MVFGASPPPTRIAPRDQRLGRSAPTPSPRSLAFAARLVIAGNAADTSEGDLTRRDRQRGGTYPRAPSAGAYTVHHAYTTSAHSEVWEACAVYLPAEGARVQAYVLEKMTEGAEKVWGGVGWG